MRHRPLSLRSSIFASYVFLLLVTLSVMIGALLILSSARPEPDTSVYQRLATLLSQIGVEDVAAEYFNRNPDSPAVSPSDLYRAFSEWHEVRVLVINPSNGAVQFDSAGVFPRLTRLRLIEASYTLPTPLQRQIPTGYRPLFGRFIDRNNNEWLFVGLEETNRVLDRAVLIADQRDTQRSLRNALIEFGTALAGPVLQASIVGFVVAFVLAALIARTIARPLQHFASAAQSIARGHYEQRVPEEGAAEVRAAAEAFNAMSAEVQATQQAQRDFLANVSHDLKTPLTSIQGYAQAIMDGASKDPTHSASIIYDEATRLSRMVAELTDLARLQGGGVTMRADPVDLVPLLEALKQRLDVVAERKGITVTLKLPKSAMIEGDGDRLAQVFMNLLSNAVKYTPEGGHVSVTMIADSLGASVAISDNGIGIPREEQARIFERFYQVDKARGPKRGTGLGLAIAREIVAAHHGRISVQSDGPNQGATFTVWLPKSRAP